MTRRQSPPALESVAEAAARVGASIAWVRARAAAGEIPGAVKVGRLWVIPADWEPGPVPGRGRPREK